MLVWQVSRVFMSPVSDVNYTVTGRKPRLDQCLTANAVDVVFQTSLYAFCLDLELHRIVILLDFY